MVAELYSEIDVSDFKFDKIEAKIIPITNYVLQGDKYEAEVLVTAFDTKQTPAVFVIHGAERLPQQQGQGTKVAGKDGVVKLAFPAGSIGLQKYAGVIEVFPPKGKESLTTSPGNTWLHRLHSPLLQPK